MTKIKSALLGFGGFFIGAILTFFGYFIFNALSNAIELTALKVFYWVGLILLWIASVLFVPLQMIIGGKGSFIDVIKGWGAFMLGYALSLLIYYVGGGIINALQGIGFLSNFTAIMWFLVYALWILILIIAPTYISIKSTIEENE